jgi:DNA-binding NarL/FixJ family response regulator
MSWFRPANMSLMMDTMRVLLVEDHPIVRAGCRRLLQERGDLEMLEAESGAAAVRLHAEQAPDLVVLDLNLPDVNGFEVLHELLRQRPESRVLVFSMYEDPTLVARALNAGARGYVTKSDDPDTLLEALDKVAGGEIFLGRSIAQKLALMSVRPGNDPLREMTEREKAVLALLGGGRSLSEIARELGMSYRTTASVAAAIRTKLDLPTMTALVKFAVERAGAGKLSPA